MTGAKQLPIAAAVAGLLAAVGITVKLATSTNPLEARADDVLARVSRPKTMPQGVAADIDELTEVLNDPGFVKLPAAVQEAVRESLKSYKIHKNYMDFESRINDLPEPKSAHSAAQLKEILDQLNTLPVPENLPEPLQHAEAVERRQQFLQDAEAMQMAFNELQKDYQKVIDAGKGVLENRNKPNLPGRIQEVLNLAKTLKTPQADKEKLLPGSSRLTYATVFQMSEIKSLIEEWIKLKNQLEPALKTKGS